MVELSRQLRGRSRSDPNALALNDVALDLIRQGVSCLDAAVRGVLSGAAVIGRSFELPLLQAITSLEPSALMASLDEALGVEVVVAAPDSTTGFAFGHELIRAVLYEALPAAERRKWHLRIAQALEARAAHGGVTAVTELAYHMFAALPDSDLRKTVHYCREAANVAALYGAADVVKYLRQALEALALLPDASPRLRISLLMQSTVYTRGCAHTDYPRLLREAQALASEQRSGTTLIQVAYMMGPHAGFKRLPGVTETALRGLELLPETALEARALGLATLSCTPPVCFDASESRARIDEAVQLARVAGSYPTLSATLLCKLFTSGGPQPSEQTLQLREEIETLVHKYPRELKIATAELGMHRAVTAAQRGDSLEVATAIAAIHGCARDIRHIELGWHADRFSLLWRINADPTPELCAALERLHLRADEFALIGHECFWAFDRAVVCAELGQLSPIDEKLRRALTYKPHDPPGIWAMKVRALACIGNEAQARGSLNAVAASDLTKLPHDRDYLGTLGLLTRAALQLQAANYCSVLYALLSEYSSAFATHISFFCEGSVHQLLGMLALALEQSSAQVRVHFEAAVAANDTAGFGLRATEARLQLASCLALDPATGQQSRALALARQAHASAVRVGLPQQIRQAVLLIDRLSST